MTDEKPIAFWDTQEGKLIPAVPLSSERTCFKVPLVPLYLHPAPKATQDENPVAFISKNGFRFNADIEPIEHGIEVPLYLHPDPHSYIRADIVDELVETLKGLIESTTHICEGAYGPGMDGSFDKARAVLAKLEEE